MPKRSFSIAQVRANLPGLVRTAERGAAVEITRRGRPVAVILSSTAYRQLTSARPPFADALASFLNGPDIGRVGLDGEEFAGLRDRAAGRKAPW